MGRLPRKRKILLKNAVSNRETPDTGAKRRYVRQNKKQPSGREEQPCTSNDQLFEMNVPVVLMEKIMKEVQTLSMEVVEFERRAQDRYRSLMDENSHLKKKIDFLSHQFARLNKSIHNQQQEKDTEAEERKPDGSKTITVSTPTVMEPKSQVNGAFDDSDVEDNQGSLSWNNATSIKPRKRRAAANKRQGDYATMLKQKFSLSKPKKSTVNTSKLPEKVVKIADESENSSDMDDSTDGSKDGNEISTWKLFKHDRIKPQPTSLPKPKVIRLGRGRNVHFTEDWKRYAKSVYPIDPSRYWNLPQTEYDRLIPDSHLEAYAKNPDKTEKEHLLRSIYDWFRRQHRVAQLRVVLSECDSAIDHHSLWDVYVSEMKRRGWPVYGKRLRKNEVTIAKQQILEDFIDCNLHLF